MKRSMLAISAILSLSIATAQTSAPVAMPAQPTVSNLTDVPAGHWARDFIDRLVSKGIILGYPDGTFRGGQNLTRYEAVAMIARLLDAIRTDPELMGSLDSEDLKSLQNAIQELAADLAALGIRVSDLEESNISKADFARLEARIEEVGKMEGSGDAEAIASIQKQIAQLSARVDEASQVTPAPAPSNDGVSSEELNGQINGVNEQIGEVNNQLTDLSAQVESNASNITALNDITVLLNQDVVDLKDRVDALDAAQSDFVQRSDFTNLTGRVQAVEGKVSSVEGKLDKVNKDLDARVSKLEKNAFSVEPTLSIGYDVSRGSRNFDIERLFPLNADGSVAKNAFGGDESSGDDARAGRDFGDFGRSGSAVVSGEEGLYGFASKAGPVYGEGRTSISFGLTFSNSGKFEEVTSQSGGSLFTTKGNFEVEKVTVDFGLVAGAPSTDKSDAYPELEKDGYTYRPIFLKFKNATTQFSVGSNPIIVTIGQGQKFYFADYAFNNSYSGRGDGYKVEVDGRSLPIIGGMSPRLFGVYGSRTAIDEVTEKGYGAYYRGLRAEIAPFQRLVAGAFYTQEGLDSFGLAKNTSIPKDVTAYGGDLHGNIFGANLHSELVYSTVTQGGKSNSSMALYARVAKRNYIVTGKKKDGSTATITTTHDSPAGYILSEADKKDGFVEVVSYDLDTTKDFDINAAGFELDTGIFGVTIHDLNYRRIEKGFDANAGISYAGYDSGNGAVSGSKQNLAFVDSKVSAPFANLQLITTDKDGKATTGDYIGQQGFGAKVSTNIGPVFVGGYYDSSTGVNGAADTNMTEMGAGAKGAIKLGDMVFGVRGSYNILDSKRNQSFNGKVAPVKVARYAVQGDVNPGWGVYISGYYRNVSIDNAVSSTDYGLLNRGYMISSYKAGTGKEFSTGTGCADRSFGTSYKDIDGVGNVLNPAFSNESSSSSTCFSSYGVELGHNGKDKQALVSDLGFRVGYASVYNDASKKFDTNMIYGDARYDRKLNIADIGVDVRVAGSYSNANRELDSRPEGTRMAAGVIAKTEVIKGLPFEPQVNGQVGYYTSNFGSKSDKASGLKYGAGIVFNDFLLPDSKLGVRYDGYNASNRSYVPFSGSTAGYFKDDANGRNTNLNGVYVEGSYKDLVFSYGTYSLSQKDKDGTEHGSGLKDSKAAQGQTFKISYKVKF